MTGRVKDGATLFYSRGMSRKLKNLIRSFQCSQQPISYDTGASMRTAEQEPKTARCTECSKVLTCKDQVACVKCGSCKDCKCQCWQWED